MKALNKKKTPIEELEVQLQRNPSSLTALCELSKLLFQQTPAPLSVTGHVDKAFQLFTANQETFTSVQGWDVAEVLLLQWKQERYILRGSMRLNTKPERRAVLTKLEQILTILTAKQDLAFQQRISLQSAYGKECQGRYPEALAMLSDLISTQAMDGVDLSYIILKAAVLLKHIGQTKQALEYLEFLLDDPPQEGFTKLHILAYLIMVYETSGEKYRVFLTKAYADLTAAAAEAHTAASSKQTKKLLDIVQGPAAQSSELWELMSIHALDRCEYVLAAELLGLAARNAPTKGSLLQRYAEVLFLLNEKDRAERVGEKALELLPESGDLRDLLIQISPDKWTDKLRYAGSNADMLTLPSISTVSPAKTSPGKPESWMDKIKSTASSAMHAIAAVPSGIARATSPIPAIRARSRQKERPASPLKTEPPAVMPVVVEQPSAAAPKAITKTYLETQKRKEAYKVPEGFVSKLKDKPDLRPRKPVLSAEGRKYLELALEGNQQVHYYSKDLDKLSNIRAQSNGRISPSTSVKVSPTTE